VSFDKLEDINKFTYKKKISESWVKAFQDATTWKISLPLQNNGPLNKFGTLKFNLKEQLTCNWDFVSGIEDIMLQTSIQRSYSPD
jgi:hypothetical protein